MSERTTRTTEYGTENHDSKKREEMAMKKKQQITYGELDNYSDDELISYYKQKAGACFCEKDVCHKIALIREYGKKLKEDYDHDNNDRLEEFRVNEIVEIDLSSLYKLICSFCDENEYICPIIEVDRKADHPYIRKATAFIPLEYDPVEVLSLIETNQNNPVFLSLYNYLGGSISSIYTIALEVCDRLSLRCPYIRIINSAQESRPIDGRYTFSMDLMELPLKTICDKKDEIVFMIAHELRHKWQSINNISIFKDHFSITELDQDICDICFSSKRIFEYNCQSEEMDANAFGYHYCQGIGLDADNIVLKRFSTLYRKEDNVNENIMNLKKMIEMQAKNI